MTHICHQLNRFSETLDDLGLQKDTWFCFVSDHGEMMGDHDLFRKGFPYEGSSRVPFLLKGPWGQKRFKPGTVVSEPVELRDVMPSLLELAGLPVPGQVEGKSVLALMDGRSGEWRSELFGEHLLFGQAIHWGTSAGEKYVWFSGTGREQLFDLDKDPLELRDLAGRKASMGRVKKWRALLAEELRGREEGFSDGRKLIPGRPVSATLSHIRK
jgi:arylsulfatase A-like enzyme